MRHDEAGSREAGRVALADRYLDGRLAVLAALAAGEALPLVAVLPPDALVETALPWPARPGWRRRLAARLGVPTGSVDMVPGKRRGTARAVAVVPRGVIEETVGFLAQSGFEPSFFAAEAGGARFPLPRKPAVPAAGGRLRTAALQFRARPGPLAAGLVTVALGTLTLMAPPDLPSMRDAAPLRQATAPVSAPEPASPAPRPAPAESAAAEPARLVTMASRSLDPETAAALARADGGAAVRTAQPGRGTTVAALTAASRPMPAPRPASEPPAEAAADQGFLRPLGRPAANEAEPPAEATPQAVALPGRPRPRPVPAAQAALPDAITAAVVEASRPVAAAAPTPSDLASASLTRAVASAPRPAPRQVWTAATLRVEPAQVAPPPGPVRTAAPIVRAAPVRQPVAIVRAAPPAQTVSRQATIGRGDLALVGVFGSVNARHALVRMPDGAVRRVRAGDQFGGLQIAAVAADSVRVRANGRDAVLRLPD